MLLILIVALLATTAFYRQAKRAGVHPGKAASVPFISAGIVLAIAYLGSRGIAKLGLALEASELTVQVVHFMLSVFLLLAYLALIRRNWILLKKAAEMRRMHEQ